MPTALTAEDGLAKSKHRYVSTRGDVITFELKKICDALNDTKNEYKILSTVAVQSAEQRKGSWGQGALQ